MPPETKTDYLDTVNPNIDWKYALASVIGTSHLDSNTTKQDYCLVTKKVINNINYFFSAVADGAGSAKFSDKSSSYICRLFTRKAEKWLSYNDIYSLNREVILSWFLHFQKVINRAVRIYNIDSIKEFATTLLFALLSEKGNIFVQIGDGVIARGDIEDLNCDVEPQNGEYINTTYFATEKNISERFMFEFNSDNIKRLVMYTDGIEIISYNFTLKKPHINFFNPIFAQLEEFDNSGLDKNTSEFIFGFLDCERVKQKTDDDKTLVIVSSIENNNT